MPIVKNALISLASLAILFAGQSQPMEQECAGKYWYTNFRKQMPFEEILKKYKVSLEVEMIINDLFAGTNYTKNIANGSLKRLLYDNNKVYESYRLPNTVIKYGADRIIGALAIQQCAAEFNCDAVKTPIKKAYIDEQGIGYVVEPKVSIVSDPFSLKQIKQLCIVIEKTGYADGHNENIVNSVQRIAYILDTEPRSFDYCTVDPKETKTASCTHSFNLKRLSRLSMENDARKWLEQRIKEKKLMLAKL